MKDLLLAGGSYPPAAGSGPVPAGSGSVDRIGNGTGQTGRFSAASLVAIAVRSADLGGLASSVSPGSSVSSSFLPFFLGFFAASSSSLNVGLVAVGELAEGLGDLGALLVEALHLL